MERSLLEQFDDKIKAIRKELVEEMAKDTTSSDAMRLIARVDYLLATISDIRIEKMSEEEKIEILYQWRSV